MLHTFLVLNTVKKSLKRSLIKSLSLCSLDLNKHTKKKKKNPISCKSLSLSQSFHINHSTTIVTIWSLTSSHSTSRWSLASMAEFFSPMWWRNCVLHEVQYLYEFVFLGSWAWVMRSWWRVAPAEPRAGWWC